MIKYHWTGEYRAPKKGEWILTTKIYPHKMHEDCDVPHFILRREELPDTDGGK